MLKIIICVVIFNICCIDGAVLIWSNQNINISPLQQFDDRELSLLIEELNYPDTSIYRFCDNISPTIKNIFHGLFSAYSPNENLNTENATELHGNDTILKEDLEILRNNEQNFLMVLVIPPDRFKRDADDEEIEEEIEEDGSNQPKGPVFYKGKSIKDEMYGLMYSSEPLILKINRSDLYLGETSPDMITMDTTAKNSYTRLNVIIRLEEGGRITLRFIFVWINSYWYLTSVRIRNYDDISYNLTVDTEISAPSRFSYHCSGPIVFSDSGKTVSLHMKDIQVQIDSTDGIFRDAYDCVSFTTVPIWSGLFVSVMLIVVLMISLCALAEIKTMDKFDNQKTKQLTITVTE